MATKPVYILRLDDQSLFLLDDQESHLLLEEGSTTALAQITLSGRSTTRGTVTYRIRHLDNPPPPDRLALEPDAGNLITREDGGYFLNEKQILLGL